MRLSRPRSWMDAIARNGTRPITRGAGSDRWKLIELSGPRRPAIAATAIASSAFDVIASTVANDAWTRYTFVVTPADIRWKQRFFNFSRALVLLREPFDRGTDTLSMLEREGAIQRFEYTFELAWKVLKDFLEAEGATIIPLTPRQVIKDAFAAGIISDGQAWIDMLDQRNLLSHNYDEQVFGKAVDAIAQRYLPALAAMHAWFREKGAE